MKFCTKCGEKIKEGRKFCTKCGAEIGEDALDMDPGAGVAIGTGIGAAGAGSGTSAGSAGVGSGVSSGAAGVGSGVSSGAAGAGSGTSSGAAGVGSGTSSGAAGVGSGVSSSGAAGAGSGTSAGTSASAGGTFATLGAGTKTAIIAGAAAVLATVGIGVGVFMASNNNETTPTLDTSPLGLMRETQPPPETSQNTPEPDPTAPPTPTTEPSTTVGDTIQFGGYAWRVLEVRDGKALILTDRIIEERQYHNDWVIVTWATSDIRKYLNGTFYNSFSEADRARIADTNVANSDNPWYGTPGGSDSNDKIFLLSLSEVVQYFGDSGELAIGPGARTDGPYTYTDNAGNSITYYNWERYWFNDQFDSARIARDSSGTAMWWWLRSPGLYPSYAAGVNLDGRVDVTGSHVDDDFGGGVRPALWLNP